MRSVKIRDYMAKPPFVFRPDMNVVEAMAQLLDKKISGAPVVDESGALVGMLSEVDLMKIIIQDSYYDESQGVVSDYMRSPVDTVDAEMDIYSLAERFIKEHRRRFPVLSQGKLVGQISRRDVLKAAKDSLQHR